MLHQPSDNRVSVGSQSGEIQNFRKIVLSLAALFKFRLSLLVVFSAGIGYLQASGYPQNEWKKFLLFLIAGFLVTGSANTFNQILERDTDKLMDRTRKRPLPSGTLSLEGALWLACLSGILGLGILGFAINFQSFLLGLVAILSYAFVYTPLKKYSPIAVLVGAIPGAIPPMLGWIAVTNQITVEAWILFGIQFFWQFPHFWSISWVLNDDYEKGGFYLLPLPGGRTEKNAFFILCYTLMVLPMGLMPFRFGMSGITALIICCLTGLIYVIAAIFLFRKQSLTSAKKLMFASFIYLPVVQLSILLDKL